MVSRFLADHVRAVLVRRPGESVAEIRVAIAVGVVVEELVAHPPQLIA
jgi:hypothetical protein